MCSGVLSRACSLPRRAVLCFRLSALLLCGVAVAVPVAVRAAPGRPAAAAPSAATAPTLFRIFLQKGLPLVSYGEFARVGGRVVFEMPVGGAASHPDLRLVDIPAGAVDWPRTDRYAASIRYLHYKETRGDLDYDRLTSRVAQGINAMTRMTDPAARLKQAEAIRRLVADWPREHYGYRANDIRDILDLLDETIAGLRARAGGRPFSLSLVAGVAPPPVVPVLPPPTPKDAIEEVLTAARLSDTATDRMSLLRLAVRRLDAGQASLPRGWVRTTRRRAQEALDAQIRWQRDYRDLVRSTVAAATVRARQADVLGVEALLAQVRREDARWGHQRPDEISALVETLQARLQAARRLKLARDRWTLELVAFKEYRREVGGVLDTLDRARRALDAIKALAGPDVLTLGPLRRRLAGALRRLSVIEPPPAMRQVQALLTSAVRLAEQAAAIRLEAATSGRLSRAWNASSAAAGALMLADQARRQMHALFEPPPDLGLK